MHSLHAQRGCCGGGCWKAKLPAGRGREAASAHDLDAQAERSHLPKGDQTHARSKIDQIDGHTILAL